MVRISLNMGECESIRQRGITEELNLDIRKILTEDLQMGRISEKMICHLILSFVLFRCFWQDDCWRWYLMLSLWLRNTTSDHTIENKRFTNTKSIKNDTITDQSHVCLLFWSQRLCSLWISESALLLRSAVNNTRFCSKRVLELCLFTMTMFQCMIP